MPSVRKCEVPANTFLEAYRDQGTYTDCYSTEVPEEATFAEYIHAFYTTSLFKLERTILAWTVSKPSTDEQADKLANGDSTAFAAWQVEKRNENELLMCDFTGRTRSWFMRVPLHDNGSPRTRLFFGSAVVPVQDRKTGKPSLGFTFQALLSFHKVYSVLLLYSARSNIGIKKGV